MKQRKALLIRIDPQLHEALETWAAQEMRSVNGQIEFLLKDAVQRRRRGAEVTHHETPPSHGDVDEATAFRAGPPPRKR